ncbi:uncharacterized protein [Nicotiana sylvestris]|uniref:uncharacterized protein n=1 Tax=Nicotiana sylvestris TaxID=4096 RepID=UPI00388C9436
MYRALSEQQDEALKDLPILQVKLEKDRKEVSSLKREHDDLVKKVRICETKNEQLVVVTNNTTLQVQEKIDLIDQLQGEMDEVKATTEVWKGKILDLEKEAAKIELASAKNQLRVAKSINRPGVAKSINRPRSQLSSAVTKRDALRQEYEALRSKLDATSFDVKEMLA